MPETLKACPKTPLLPSYVRLVLTKTPKPYYYQQEKRRNPHGYLGFKTFHYNIHSDTIHLYRNRQDLSRSSRHLSFRLEYNLPSELILLLRQRAHLFRPLGAIIFVYFFFHLNTRRIYRDICKDRKNLLTSFISEPIF